MEPTTIGTAINVLLMAAYTIGAAWRGYRRRQAHWSGASWVAFGATLLLGFAMLGFAFFFSASVGDDHAAWVGAPGSTTRSLWIVASLPSLVGGTLLTTCTLAWFALGDPTRPFPFFARLVTAVVRRYRPRLRPNAHRVDAS